MLVVQAALRASPAPLSGTDPQPAIAAPLLVNATLPVGLVPVTLAVKVRLCFTLAGLSELASAVDNPVVLETGEVESTGNFHGEPLAFAADFLAIAAAEIVCMTRKPRLTLCGFLRRKIHMMASISRNATVNAKSGESTIGMTILSITTVHSTLAAVVTMVAVRGWRPPMSWKYDDSRARRFFALPT